MNKNVIIFNRANEIEKFSCVIKFFLQTLAAQDISEIAKNEVIDYKTHDMLILVHFEGFLANSQQDFKILKS
jgi:hypothetical protein